MASASKTPYEVRLELLQLASAILTYQHNVKLKKSESADTELNDVDPPTTEQIIAEAEKLNEFVSKQANR